MKLNEKANKVLRRGERAAIAKAAGISPSHLMSIICSGRTPSRDVALRIEKATGGRLTAADVLRLHEDEAEGCRVMPAS